MFTFVQNIIRQFPSNVLQQIIIIIVVYRWSWGSWSSLS